MWINVARQQNIGPTTMASQYVPSAPPDRSGLYLSCISPGAVAGCPVPPAPQVQRAASAPSAAHHCLSPACVVASACGSCNPDPNVRTSPVLPTTPPSKFKWLRNIITPTKKDGKRRSCSDSSSSSHVSTPPHQQRRSFRLIGFKKAERGPNVEPLWLEEGNGTVVGGQKNTALDDMARSRRHNDVNETQGNVEWRATEGEEQGCNQNIVAAGQTITNNSNEDSINLTEGGFQQSSEQVRVEGGIRKNTETNCRESGHLIYEDMRPERMTDLMKCDRDYNPRPGIDLWEDADGYQVETNVTNVMKGDRKSIRGKCGAQGRSRWVENVRVDGKFTNNYRNESSSSTSSFDTRWDLVHRQRQSSCSGAWCPRNPDTFGVRPSTGWMESAAVSDNVGITSRSERNHCKDSIGEIGVNSSQRTNVLSNSLHQPNHAAIDAFDMHALSYQMSTMADGLASKSRPTSMSTTNIAPHSARNSPTDENAPSTIKDTHLWASSDSFICEDFSLLEHRRCRDDSHDGILRSLRSYSQFYLNSLNHNDYADPGDEDVFVAGGDNPRVSEVRPASAQTQTSSSPYTRRDVPRNWVTFDSVERLDNINCTEKTHEDSSTLCDDRKNNCNISGISGAFRDSTGDDSTHDESPVSPDRAAEERNIHGSTDNLVGPGLQLAADPYPGQLVRSCSRRGRRASKRVMVTVSRHLNTADYGKMKEPVPPRFSKAVMTMQSGPGLFEKPTLQENSTDLGVVTDQLDNFREATDDSNINAISPPVDTPEESPNLNIPSPIPVRVGSLRVPKMSKIFVRRSVSFNVPGMDREDIKFQRLTEKRSSFRQAMAGIGALARSMRKGKTRTKSGKNGDNSDDPSSELEDPGPDQVPDAPRLPRRSLARNT